MRSPSRKRPTQREVAELAGVSQAAVSQVLNGRGGEVRIPEATRQRVLQVMQQVGYVPNVAARRLKGGLNRILGVFTYDAVFPSSTNDFFTPFLQGIEEAAAELDFDLLLHTRPAAHGLPRPIYRDGTSRLRLADGTVMLGLIDDHRRKDLARLLSEGHPVVFIGRREVPNIELPYVTADYAAATNQAIKSLRARGHHHVLYLGACTVHESGLDRERGYLASIEAFGMPGGVVRADVITEEFVAHQLALGVTGFVAENERLAAQWVEAASRLGAQWPQHYGFALLGDPIFSGELPEGWAHYRIPRLQMGRAAVEMLTAILTGDRPSSVVLECQWREADSLGENIRTFPD